jgi:glucose/arabinose dehydrogenase
MMMKCIIRLLSLAVFWMAPVLAVDLRLTQVTELGDVVDIKHAGDGSERMFLLQQNGVVRILSNGQLLPKPFVDISNQVLLGSEQGLLSLDFSPNFSTNGRVYLYYSNLAGNTVLSRFIAKNNIIDPSTEEILLVFNQPSGNHNGGRIEFGADGMLYLGLGDGGGAGDTDGNAQNRQSLLGKIIRLDVESPQSGFVIPADNPFINDPSTRSEIWALGLRNPWRMAFDSLTGDLFIADVGQAEFEEVNFQPANSPGGDNYGWNIMEATTCFNSTGCDSSGLTMPVSLYDHSNGDCSITGGQVYRGTDYPDLVGRYLYGDFCSGRIWSLKKTGDNWQVEILRDAGAGMFTFGEDQRGNVYMATAAGVFLLSDGEPSTIGLIPTIPIDGSVSGSYVVDGLLDQGFILTVGNNAQGNFVFITWFTYDEFGQPLWLVGNDFLGANADRITLTMQRLQGSSFLSFSGQPATRTDVGQMTLVAVDCNTLQADFNFGALGADSLTLKRLTNIQGRDCQ